MPACPGVVELDQFLSGELSDEAGGEIAGHISSCAICQSTLHDLERNRRIEPIVHALLTESEDLSPLAAEGDFVGPYRILRELGRGGSGVVYVAEQQNPRRQVAVKVIHCSGRDATKHERSLQREARALARLQHPSIAAVYDAGRTDTGQLYLAMERVDGVSLTAFSRRNKQSVSEKLELFIAVADAVTSAHQRGVIHRDLKPSNVLVQDNGRPKVLDFGLAKIFTADSDDADAPPSLFSEVGRVAGTIPYMSPEQVSGANADLDVRSDVYALGVMLFELLTGQLPYVPDKHNLVSAARTICETQPPIPSTLQPQCRGDLDIVLLKALEKEPTRRYASVAEFAGDVRRYLNHEPITAKPAGTWYTLKKFAQRQRATVAVAIVSFVLLVIATGTAIGQAVSATHQRDAAQRRLVYAQEAAAYVLWGVGSQIDYVLGTRDIKRHLAEVSYKYHRRLAEEQPNDPSAQLGLWRALQTLVHLSIEVGDDERVVVLTDMLREKLDQLARVHPDDAVVRRTEAAMYAALCRHAEMRGDLAEARNHADQMLQIAQTLADRYDPDQFESVQPEDLVREGTGTTPTCFQDQIALVQAHIRVADLSDDSNTAQTHYEEALRLLDTVMPFDPTLDPIYRDDLSDYAPLAPPILLRVGSRPHYLRQRAAILGGMGSVELRRGQFEKARQFLDESLATNLGLLRENPDQPANIAAVAATHARVAELALNEGDFETAEFHATQAYALHDRLAAADPRNVENQALLSRYSGLIDAAHPK